MNQGTNQGTNQNKGYVIRDLVLSLASNWYTSTIRGEPIFSEGDYNYFNNYLSSPCKTREQKELFMKAWTHLGEELIDKTEEV